MITRVHRTSLSAVIMLLGAVWTAAVFAQPSFLLAFKGEPAVGNGTWAQFGCTGPLSNKQQSLLLRFRYGKIKKSNGVAPF